MTTTALSTFRVTLQDCDGIKPDLKKKAEARFVKTLERGFPSQDAMSHAFKLFNDASEGGVISKADERTALSWQKAYEAARQAGLQDIGMEEAFFEVRLN